ncbi:MAG: MFS transporter, partial [Candidatus Bathyarchaeota archaeon]
MTMLYVIAAIWRLRLKETMNIGEPIRFRYFISSYPKAIRESINVWKEVPRSMFWLFIVQTLVMFSLALTQVINQIYAIRVLGITLDQWWLVYIPLLLTITIASLPIGKAVDRFGRKIPLATGITMFAIATTTFALGNFSTVMISMVLFAIARLLTMSAIMALSTDLVNPANRGKVVGFRNFVGYIAMGFGMLLGSALFVEGFNMGIPQLPFYLALGLIIPELLILLRLVHEPGQRAGMIVAQEAS